MEQLPPMARLTARSADTVSQVSVCTSGRRASTKSWRSVRISMPRAPWPAAGNISVGAKTWRIRAPSSRRLSPAAASTMPAYWPSSSLRSRVSRLPRRGSMRRSGRSARISTVRRRLDVPTTAPCGRSARLANWGETKASRGSSRSITQASAKPSGRSMGTSLRECTARSARPSSSAVSSSFTNRPLPPTLLRDRSRIWSPLVVIPSSVTWWPCACSKALTCSACHSARRLSRVAMVMESGVGLGWLTAVSGGSGWGESAWRLAQNMHASGACVCRARWAEC